MNPIMPNVEPPQQPAEFTLDQILQQAVSLHRSGHFQEAAERYRTILQTYPRHPEANHNLGVLAVQTGHAAAGLTYFTAALEANPEHGQYWLSYIDALFQAGQIEAAREVMALARQQGLQGDEADALTARVENAEQDAMHQPAVTGKGKTNSKSIKKTASSYGNKPTPHETAALIALFNEGRYAESEKLARAWTLRFPKDGFGWKALGTVLMHTGRNADALIAMRKAATLSANDASAHNNLGTILSELGQLHEAESSLRRALAIDENFAAAHCNLGSTLQALGRLDEAETSYRRALQISPDLAEAHYNLANNLKEMGRPEEAIVSYRNALQIKPDYAQAHSNLGVTLNDLGRADEAETSLRLALQIKPDFAQAYSNLGNVLQDMGQLDEAEACYRHALQLRPEQAETLNNLGNTLQDMGRLNEAEISYRHALAIKPDYAKAHSNLLFLLNYNNNTADAAIRNFAEAEYYGHRVSSNVTSRFTDWICSKHPERLRIGLVSGDMRNHPVGYFLENLLRRLDQHVVELIAYPTDHRADELTQRLLPCFAAWKPLSGLSDAAAARLIHDDGIHILIDLSGHTRYNRLPIFAWKPAPVQVSWLGYFATTGVKEIDYLIADAWTLPESEAGFFTEKIWRLPETRLCFTPPDMTIDVGPLPALVNGYITFGCFNNLAKMNESVVALWARVLSSVPDSKLFLKARQLQAISQRQLTIERFAAHGIAPERLILEGPSLRENYMAAYHKVDIALDPFPFTGGTTSVECLWMGVPVLTLSGTSFLSRQGLGLLMNAGLADWVAVDENDYVARAVIHATDLSALSYLRNGLRQQVTASSIMDGERFAQQFTTALRSMWQSWEMQHHRM
jgi:protein O-GlcNAc transferase